jgi:hypothetical protein
MTGAARHGREEDDYGRTVHDSAWRGLRHRRVQTEGGVQEKRMTPAQLEAALLDAKARSELETLRNREESSIRRRRIARNNAAILLTWFGALAILLLTSVLIAVSVEYLIWLSQESTHHAAASELFPAGLLELLTSATSGLSLITIGVACRRVRAPTGGQ